MKNRSAQNQYNKSLVWDYWQRLDYAAPDQVDGIVSAACHEEIEWHGCHPLNNIQGVDSLISEFWELLRRAFPDLNF